MKTAYLEEVDSAVIGKQLAEHEAEVAVLRREQARMVAELDRRQAATPPGTLAARLPGRHVGRRRRHGPKLVDLARVDGELVADAVTARGDELHAASDLPSTPCQRAADGRWPW